MQTVDYIDYAQLLFSHFAATSGEEGRKALMREIELGKLFGETEQPNIIKFIGSVSTEGNYIQVPGICEKMTNIVCQNCVTKRFGKHWFSKSLCPNGVIEFN